MVEYDNMGNPSHEEKDEHAEEPDQDSKEDPQEADVDQDLDDYQEGDTVASFGYRHRIPVNVVRERNPDSVDELGNVTGTLTK